jgi:addiction module RelE/StbE family toxin
MGETRPVNVRFTRPALADLQTLIAYVDARSPRSARHIRQRIRSAVARLAEHPRLGRQTDDPTIRRLTVVPYPYLVFYEVTDASIIIHAVRHGARDPASMPDQP